MSPVFGPNTLCRAVFSVVRCIDSLNPQKNLKEGNANIVFILLDEEIEAEKGHLQ